jgi:hypothetical protein
MASHFKWYPSETEVVVPFNARYSFPSQANKAVKMTPRIPPKSGYEFAPSTTFRLEFPAQGYVNPANTTLEFDVEMVDYADPKFSMTRFQNNIQSLFQRVRLLYGSTPIEDIINYNVIVRALTEWTGTSQQSSHDQTSITDGVGGVTYGLESAASPSVSQLYRSGLVNVRQAYIQGLDNSTNTAFSGDLATNTVAAYYELSAANGFGKVPNNASGGRTSTRRYQVSLALGLFTQEKLIPTKFMASQLAIEITLETPAACMYSIQSGSIVGAPTYRVKNVNLIPEILEFDASYDAMFLKGLQEGGVPIKFSSWHTYVFSTGGSSNLNLQIQERSRSVKAIFAVQRRGPIDVRTDSGAMLFCSNNADDGSVGARAANTLQSYQFRIGGRYFPASPVQCSIDSGSDISNGGCEAFVELQKALNIMGDYRLSTSVNSTRWALSPASIEATYGSGTGEFKTTYAETDFSSALLSFNAKGQPLIDNVTLPLENDGNSFAGPLGSSAFAMAIDLETSNGVEISGLNAEEQSDISLIATYKGPQNSKFTIEVYTYFDSMIILRENNVLELIQ